jgi:hypothetical protein
MSKNWKKKITVLLTKHVPWLHKLTTKLVLHHIWLQRITLIHWLLQDELCYKCWLQNITTQTDYERSCATPKLATNRSYRDWLPNTSEMIQNELRYKKMWLQNMITNIDNKINQLCDKLTTKHGHKQIKLATKWLQTTLQTLTTNYVSCSTIWLHIQL